MSFSLDANWKIAVENYLECYHCAVAHPSFSEVIDVRPDRYLLERHPTFGSHYAQPARRRRPTATAHVDGQFHLIWPNIKVNVMPGRANLSVGPLVPNGPDSTDGFLDYFFGPDSDPDWIADYLELDYQVGDEDRVLVESVQRGMRSGAFERGRLMLPSEELIGEFQRWVAGAARSDAVARERQLPRARVDLLVALVGVEPLGDEELGRRRGHRCSACRRARARSRARASSCSVTRPRPTAGRRPTIR